MRLVVVVMAMLAGSTPPAHAQSFFEKLFGLGSRPPPPAQSAPPAPSYRAPVRAPQSRAERSESGDSGSQTGKGWQVRTMCVRLCDGYYFPLSEKVSVKRLTMESRRCKSSCGSDARLFYMSAGDINTAAMVDFSGRRYDALKTAFDYRKKLLPGCSCKPAPWSAVERLRHINYGLQEAIVAAKARAAEEKFRQVADATAGATLTPHVRSEATLRPASYEGTASDSGLTPTEVPAPVPVSSHGAAPTADAHHDSEFEDAPRARRNQGGVVRRGRAVPQPTRATAPPALRSARQLPPPVVATAPPSSGVFGLGGGKNLTWPGDVR